jgi:death-on-curing protein
MKKGKGRGRTPVWIEKRAAVAFHAEQLAEHGGVAGIRDEALLESALARPKNLHSYAERRPSLCALASCYAWGLAHNHPFADGNKRTALVVAFAFLGRNGLEVKAAQEETYAIFQELAAGRVTEAMLAAWLEKHTVAGVDS